MVLVSVSQLMIISGSQLLQIYRGTLCWVDPRVLCPEMLMMMVVSDQGMTIIMSDLLSLSVCVQWQMWTQQSSFIINKFYRVNNKNRKRNIHWSQFLALFITGLFVHNGASWTEGWISDLQFWVVLLKNIFFPEFFFLTIVNASKWRHFPSH